MPVKAFLGSVCVRVCVYVYVCAASRCVPLEVGTTPSRHGCPGRGSGYRKTEEEGAIKKKKIVAGFGVFAVFCGAPYKAVLDVTHRPATPRQHENLREKE